MVHRPPLLKYSFISSLYALYSKNLDLHAIGASIISSPITISISLGIAAYIPEENKLIEHKLVGSHGFYTIAGIAYGILPGYKQCYMGNCLRDLNLDPGKILTAGFTRPSRKKFDIGQYNDVINSSESQYHYHAFYICSLKN